MNKHSWLCVAVGLLLFAATTLCAQEPPPPPPEGMMAGEPPPDGPGPIGERVELLGFEGPHSGKTVTGAPFSANATTETSQTLADGTVIHRSNPSVLYRDSQGRFRREMTLGAFGPLQAAGTSRTVITIADPIAGARYTLDADRKLARKMNFRGRAGGPDPDKAQAFEQRMQERMQKEEASGAVKKESLGTQNINGVAAEGTRITRTIPAGQIGNDKPIQVVFERWYSPDLQMVVKSIRTDPRFGTTSYTLTNIQRNEPAATLFAVPAGYTVQQGGRGPGGPGRRGRGGPPPQAGPAN